MKFAILVLCASLAGPAFARSLDRARVTAARLEAKLPGGGPLLCAACDADWSDGGEPVRRLERVLELAANDPRAATLPTHERLGELLAEHFTTLLIEAAGEDKPKTTGKETVCALSRPPCELFTPKLFVDFCTPPEGL